MTKRILATVLLAGAICAMSATAANSRCGSAATICFDETAQEEQPDTTDPDTDIRILSDAEIYFNENNLHFPLENLQDTDNYQAWVDSASTVLKLFPNDADALYFRAAGNAYLGKNEAAIDDALTGLHDSLYRPTFENIILYVGYRNPELTQTKVRSLTADYMADPDPKNADDSTGENLRLLSSLYRQDARMAEAYQAARLAYETDPACTDCVILMTTTLLLGGRSDFALKMLEPLYKDKGVEGYQSVIHNYAIALRNTGKLKKAIKVLKKELKENPEYPGLQLLYGSMLALAGKNREAEKLFRSLNSDYNIIHSYFPDENYDIMALEANVRLAMLLISEGREEEGTEMMRQSLKQCEQYAFPTGFETTLAGWLGDRATAEKYLEAYGDVAADSKAAIYTLLGDFPTALKYLKEAFGKHTICPEAIQYDPNYKKLLPLPEYQQLVKEFRKVEVK